MSAHFWTYMEIVRCRLQNCRLKNSNWDSANVKSPKRKQVGQTNQRARPKNRQNKQQGQAKCESARVQLAEYSNLRTSLVYNCHWGLTIADLLCCGTNVQDTYRTLLSTLLYPMFGCENKMLELTVWLSCSGAMTALLVTEALQILSLRLSVRIRWTDRMLAVFWSHDHPPLVASINLCGPKMTFIIISSTQQQQQQCWAAELNRRAMWTHIQ